MVELLKLIITNIMNCSHDQIAELRNAKQNLRKIRNNLSDQGFVFGRFFFFLSQILPIFHIIRILMEYESKKMKMEKTLDGNRGSTRLNEMKTEE